MKKYRLGGLLAAMLLLSSCHDGFREHVYRGLLFTDSTLATAFAGQTLTFYSNSSYVGEAIADAKRVILQIGDDLPKQEGLSAVAIHYDVDPY